MDRLQTPLVISGVFGTLGVSMGLYSLLQPFSMTTTFGVPSPPPLLDLPTASLSTSSTTSKRSSKRSSSTTTPSLPTPSLPVRDESHNCILAFARAKGARDLASGVTYYGLTLLGNQKAVGIYMITQATTAAVDGAIVYQHGVKHTAWGHFVTALIIAATGAWIMSTAE